MEAVAGIPDYGQAVAVVLSAAAGLVTAIAGLVRIIREHKTRSEKDGPPDPDAPDAPEIWMDVFSKLNDAETERDEWKDRYDEAVADRDSWRRMWTECNDERLTLLREKRRGGRREGPS